VPLYRNRTEELQAEFLAWLQANGLPTDAGDAEDLLFEATEGSNPLELLEVHTTYLANFCQRWNAQTQPPPAPWANQEIPALWNVGGADL
jgi:hypothetical protein